MRARTSARMAAIADVRQLVAQVGFEGISARDALVLSLRFGLAGDEPLTGKETADRLGLSVSRIKQMEDRAVRALRARLR